MIKVYLLKVFLFYTYPNKFNQKHFEIDLSLLACRKDFFYLWYPLLYTSPTS